MFTKVPIFLINLGGIQYFSESNDQVSHCNIALFVHSAQTLFSRLEDMETGHNRYPRKAVHPWLFITNLCRWDERLTLIRHQVFYTSFWATPGHTGFTGSKWSMSGCIIAQKKQLDVLLDSAFFICPASRHTVQLLLRMICQSLKAGGPRNQNGEINMTDIWN